MANRRCCVLLCCVVACARPEPAATHSAKHQAPLGANPAGTATDQPKRAVEASPAASLSQHAPLSSNPTVAAADQPKRAVEASPAASLSQHAPLDSSATVAAADATRPTSPTTPNAAPSCHLLGVGDSLTDPKSGGGGYLETARQRCGCKLTNLGKGGAMVNQIRAKLLSHLAETPVRYSHIVIFGGVNDLYSDLTAKRSVAKIEADLSAMYQAARQRGARVIALTVTPWGGFRRYFSQHRWQTTLELNRWIRESRGRGQTDRVIDGEQLLSCGPPELLCEAYAKPYRDGLHFGPGGHQRLAAAMVQALGLTQCQRLPDDGSAGD